ncbi:MAG: AAA family ATPase [Deltaproteobacteria bacterium]|nr:AAA family ATPase [Deltaproteobacteria bacterium]
MADRTLEKFSEELSSLIRARYPLIYLNTYEELRCQDVLKELGKQRDSSLFLWTRTDGISKDGRSVADVKDPGAALAWYESISEKSVLILKDYHPYLKEPGIIRKLRDLGQSLKRTQKNIVILSPVVQVPTELAKEIAILEVPLPSRQEIRDLIRKAECVLSIHATLSESDMEALVDAACGLTGDEIENVLAKSIVSRGKIDKLLVQDEKRQIVKKSGLLEFVHTESVVGIGGLHSLRQWLQLRRQGFSPEARAINLPTPRGILLVGIPGCGKSLTAMTVGREWQLPLLRLDMGKIFSGIVGSSESNIRSAIATCEAVAPCILWVDEIEKGLSGTKSSGQTDGGTTSRVFGTILTWMQEKKSPVFVVATANDISQLPPEFLRKGRFDEIFFVDLPSDSERREIFRIHLERFGWDPQNLELDCLVQKTAGFSGAEIEQVLVAARYLAFGRNESFSQVHIVQGADETVPLAKTMADRIEFLRTWAEHRARHASAVTTESEGDPFQMRTNSLEMRSQYAAGEKNLC